MDFTSLFHNTPIKTVDVDGVPVAFRTFGPENGTPLVMQQRFRGSMDDWDPALIATLAKERRLVIWDNTGIGFSGGSVQGSITEMAETAASFIDALGFSQVDLLGFSVGGYITQRLALLRPGLVRNIILAGTGPGGGDLSGTRDRILGQARASAFRGAQGALVQRYFGGASGNPGLHGPHLS
jgi:pimeloyl-ACP methyl ester carboxylesterase